MSDQLLTPALMLLLTGLVSAAVLFGTNWLTQRSLKTTLENLRLTTEIAAREAEAANATARVQGVLLTKVVEAAAETKALQMETGAKVDGQMGNLHTEIAALRNALAAANLARITEQEKAGALAVQTERDRAAAATLAEVKQQGSTTPPPTPGPPPEAPQPIVGVPSGEPVPVILVPPFPPLP